MRAFVIACLLVATTSSAAFAGVTRVERRTVPLREHSLRLATTPHVQPREALETTSQPNPVAPPVSKATAVLNCENDNVIDPANTLVLEPGDLAGNIFEVPAEPSPYKVTEFTVGLFDFNQTFPATLEVDFFEDNGVDGFDFVTGFTVEIDAISAEGEVFMVDISEFNLTGSNDILTLYGDAKGQAEVLMLPAGDASARCLNATSDNVCSVHLPAEASELFIYGLTDAEACPRAPNNILNFDLVHEVTIDDISVPTASSSWGTLKSKF